MMIDRQRILTDPSYFMQVMGGMSEEHRQDIFEMIDSLLQEETEGE